MRELVRNAVIVAVVLLLAVYGLYPPGEKLRLGKDLAGGVSLVYAVDIRPGEPAREVLNRVIDVIRDRVDPTGQMEITIVAQGTNRIEISMPLPTERVKQLRAEFEEVLAELDRRAVSVDEFERMMRLPAGERAERIEEAALGDAERLERFEAAARVFDRIGSARGDLEEAGSRLEAAEAALREARGLEESPEREAAVERAEAELARAEREFDAAATEAARAELAYEGAREEALAMAVSGEQLRRILSLPDDTHRLEDRAAGEWVTMPGARTRALERLYEENPGARELIDRAIAAWERYDSQRRTLDDPSDLIRLLRGAGVLNFRITVNPGDHPEEERLRRELRENGPRAVRGEDARWFRVNRIENWYDTVQDLQRLLEDPTGFFAGRGYVVEEFEGQYYMLCWDTRDKRLTEADGRWGLAGARRGVDQLGRPAIDFEMDTLGTRRLGNLTGPHVGENMAVLLDNEVYTAPRLLGRIARRGQITGQFSTVELNYIIRVLTAGQLQAMLSPEPISQSVVGPELGADNLRQGLNAGIVALLAVSVFMVLYYYGYGAVAVTALVMNGLIILGAMAFQRAAFTLPGIAGIVLTFGIAVDANVLIYERIREELLNKADLRTAVRLGYQRALSAIVDGNVTNLIVCVVLGFMGTPEIKGFAITLGIGVVATMFTALFATRVFFTFFVDHLKIRRMAMLPMTVPLIERVLTPSVDWMRMRGLFAVISIAGIGLGVLMITVQGEEMLDTVFRGGTDVEIRLRSEEDGSALTMTRAEVQERIRASGYVHEDSPVRELANAQVLVVNPQADGVTSDRFRIKTVLTDSIAVQDALVDIFRDVVDSRPPVRFDAAGEEDYRRAPVYPVLTGTLGENIDRPELRHPVGDFRGGVAIVLDNLEPAVGVEGLEARFQQLRSQPDFVATLGRTERIIVIRGTERAAEAAVFLVHDQNIDYFLDEATWGSELASSEWSLVRSALTQTTTLANVESFSPAVAATFRAQATVAVFLAAVLILIYVWVRFGSVRYSLAAITAVIHDCLIVVGMIAVAEIIYERAPNFAQAVGILPFKIDLNLIAALLTILGYSLNDSIVIMDRIRENRGKLPYASRAVINMSINQTMSRTVITSGTTLIAILVLYIFGGERVREFAYALLIGIAVGTYSTIAVASPMVWSRRLDRTGGAAETPEEPGPVGGEPERLPSA